MKSRGVRTYLPEMESASSTPNSGMGLNGAVSLERLQSSSKHLLQSPPSLDTERSNDANRSTCSSTVVYKMKALGKPGERPPTHIEFNRVERVHKKHQSRTFMFQKSSNQRPYKYSTDNSPVQQSKTNCNSNFLQMSNHSVKKITKNKEDMKTKVEQIELYYFDHGNSGYLYTTDCPPLLSSNKLANQTNDVATKFWAEFYGSIHIVVAILIAFVLQTFRFIMYSVVRPMLVGALQILADYGIKPLLTVLFNGLLQPPLILGLNVLNSMADMLEPVARTIRNFINPVCEMLQAVRLVEINHHHHPHQKTRDSFVDGDVEEQIVNENENDAPQESERDVEDVL